jgi:hypothetical protein
MTGQMNRRRPDVRIQAVINRHNSFPGVERKCRYALILDQQSGAVRSQTPKDTVDLRLPDTAGAGPVLGAVIVADFPIQGRTRESVRKVVVIDEHGSCVARWPPCRPRDFDLLWPAEQFDTAAAAGVAVRYESFASPHELNNAYPGSFPGWRRLTPGWNLLMIFGVLVPVVVLLSFVINVLVSPCHCH